MKYWEIIADNLSKAGWSWGCVSAVDPNGRTIFIADAHRDDEKRFSIEVRDRADKLPLHLMNHHDVTPSGEQNRVSDRGHNCRSWLVAFP